MTAQIIVLAERRKSLRRREFDRLNSLVWPGIIFGSALFWVFVAQAAFGAIAHLTRPTP